MILHDVVRELEMYAVISILLSLILSDSLRYEENIRQI